MLSVTAKSSVAPAASRTRASATDTFGRGRAATAFVAALVTLSSLPASSVNSTRTFSRSPSSASTTVYVAPVAPGMSAPPRSHW